MCSCGLLFNSICHRFADVSSYCVAEKAFLGYKILAGAGMCPAVIETMALKICDIVTVCVNFHSLPKRQNDLILIKNTAEGTSTGFLNGNPQKWKRYDWQRRMGLPG